MERSWLQQQASLSKFDGYRNSEPLSKVKVTAAPAPKACDSAREAGLRGDVVYDPQDALADWSGFAPRNCAGRRMHDGGLPAAHKETIVRSEEHGIVPAADTITEDSTRTRRRIIAEPAKAGERLVLGGPEAPRPEERFKTVARAANAQESTPLEMKSEGCRYQKNIGKKHVVPPYERMAARSGNGGGGPQADRGNVGARNASIYGRAQLGDPLLQQQPSLSSRCAGDYQDIHWSRRRAAASSGPGSFLNGLGRQMVQSEAAGGDFYPLGARREGGRGGGGDGRAAEAAASPSHREIGPRTKELFTQKYNPYPGYTGHQPRKF